MKLNQISANDEVTQLVVRKMMERSTVLQYAEFYSMSGNAEYARKAATATGGQFRALDADYPANTVSPEYTNPALRILGDQVQIDQAHERRGYDISSVRATELLNFAVNLGKQFQSYFFNGDSLSVSNQFDGLKVITPTAQTIVAAQNGLTIDTGNSDTAKSRQQKFLELLDTLIESVDGGAEVLFMDGRTLSRVNSIAREYITLQANKFGDPVRMYNGIPLIATGYDKTGARIIGHGESTGNVSTTTSVYAVRFGERADLTIATNIGVEVQDLGLVGPFYTHKVEMDAAPVLLNDKAVARLSGLIIS
jgi:hypothetical protein